MLVSLPILFGYTGPISRSLVNRVQIPKGIWTHVSPPISGDLENVEIPTNTIIAKKQSWYNPNFITIPVIARIRTIDFLGSLAGFSMSRSGFLAKDIVAVSIAVETESSKTLPQFGESPRKRITFIKIILATVCGQAKEHLTIQRTSADFETLIVTY